MPGPHWSWRHFDYNSTGEPPLFQSPVKPLLDQAAETWTDQVNNCGWPDETNVLLDVSDDPPNNTGINNFYDDIYWVYGQNIEGAIAEKTFQNCDIKLNGDFWNQETPVGTLFQTQLSFASMVAREMGHCLGLDHGGNQYQTMRESACVVGFNGNAVGPKSCGLTLGKGDMNTLIGLYG